MYLEGEWGTKDNYIILILLKFQKQVMINLASASTTIDTVFSECGKSSCNSALHCVLVDLHPDPSCTHDDDDIMITCLLLSLDIDFCYSHDTQLFLNP